jgi:hypothetical protein
VGMCTGGNTQCCQPSARFLATNTQKKIKPMQNLIRVLQGNCKKYGNTVGMLKVDGNEKRGGPGRT